MQCIIFSFWWGSCWSVFSFLCCFLWTIIFLFAFFIFSHGVVTLFSIYEFDFSFGIFRPSFKTVTLTLLAQFTPYVVIPYINPDLSHKISHPMFQITCHQIFTTKCAPNNLHLQLSLNNLHLYFAPLICFLNIDQLEAVIQNKYTVIYITYLLL